jgi:hypothetical protein
MPKLKNIIIFVIIATVFVLIYLFYIKKGPETPALIYSSGAPAVSNTTAGVVNETQTQDFLSLLLNVKNINLDNAIFSDDAFMSLRDSSITLTPDGNEGRINPFAPIGSDVVIAVAPTCVLPQVLDTATNTCVTPTPAVVCTLPKVLNTFTNTCVTPITCTLPKVRDTATNTCVNPF